MTTLEHFQTTAKTLYQNLRPYQREDVDKILEMLESSNINSIMRQIFTGCGKSVEQTFLSFNWLAKSEEHVVLFLVHRKELIENSEDYYKKLKTPYCVIKAGRVNLWNQRIFLGSIDSIRSDKKLKEFENFLNKNPNKPKKLLIIGDEFHRSEAKTYQKVLDFFPNKKLVGFTATPKRTDGKGFEETYQELIKTSYRYQWFINNKYLSEFEVVRPKQLVSDAIKIVRGDYSLEEQQQYYEKNPEIFGDIFECYEKFCWYPRCNLIGGEKVFYQLKNMIFAPDLTTSQKIVNKYNEWSQKFLNRDIAIHIDSNTPDDIREDALKRFQLPSEHPDSFIVISNFSLFLEGYNLPSLSVTQWLRKSKSVIVVCQGNGRSCRYEEGKIQWILDHVGNTLEHGNPDEDREFNLEGEKKLEKDYSISCMNCGKLITENYIKLRKELEYFAELKKEKMKDFFTCECGGEITLPKLTKRERKKKDELIFNDGVEWEVGTSKEIQMFQLFRKWDSIPIKTFLQKLLEEGCSLDDLIQACDYRKHSREFANNAYMQYLMKKNKPSHAKTVSQALSGKF